MRQTIQDPRSSSRDQTFPAGWGEPPGSRFSSERAAWIARNIYDAAGGASGHVAGETTAEAALRTVERLAEKPNRSAYVALARADSLARSSHNAWHRALHLAMHPPS